jgi:D-glycero-alpha-D-manno-heptose-7-phosphate kinase
MLFFTGFSRIADKIAKSKIDNMKSHQTEIFRIREMVDEAIFILTNSGTKIDEFGKLLDQGWKYKRSLSKQVSTPEIDHIYDQAMLAGAVGGKILGAGGGGFMLLFVRPENQPAVRERLKNLVHVPFNFESSGSRVVVYQPNGL